MYFQKSGQDAGSHQEVIKSGCLRLPKVTGFRKKAYIAYYHDEVKFKITFYTCKGLTGKVPMDCQILHKML